MKKLTTLMLAVLCLLVAVVPAFAEQDVIKLWTYPVHQQYDKELPVLIAEFEARNPGIKVEYEILAWAEGTQKFDVALNAGSPPDVYWVKPDPKYVQTGLMVPLDPYLTPEERADYSEIGLEGFSREGKLYGLPLYVFIYTLGGNRELLEEAGIDWRRIQQEGWTWDEFFAACQKLTKKLPDGRTQYGFVMPGYNSELLEFLMLNNGAPQIVSAKGELLWTEEKVRESMEFIRKLMDEGVMPKECSGMSAIKRWELFNSWDTAMFGRGIPYFEVMSINRRKDIEAGKIEGRPIDYVSLPIPYKAGAPQRTFGGVEGYSLFRQKRYQGDTHTENAAKLLRFLTGPEAGSGAVELAYMPVSKRGQELHKEKIAKLNPDNVAFTQTQLTRIHWPEPVPVEIGAKESRIKSEVILPLFQALMAYEMTPDEAAKAFVERATRILRR